MTDIVWWRIRVGWERLSMFGRALRVESRRSPVKWWALVILVGQLAILFGRDVSWIGVWPETSVVPQIGAAMTSPILAAAAAWAANRTVRSGIAPQLSAAARPGVSIELPALSATILWGLAPLVVTNVVADLTTRSVTGGGHLWQGYVALGVAIGLFAVAAGHTVGRLTASRFAPPLVGIGVLLALMTASNVGAPMVVFRGLPYYYPYFDDVGRRVAVAAVLVSMALATGALAVAAARRWVRFVPVLASVVLLPVGVAWCSGGEFPYGERVAHAMECDGDPRVCVWPEHAKYLPELASAATRIAELNEFVTVPPDGFHERGLPDGFVSGPNVPHSVTGFGMELRLWGAVNEMVSIAEEESGARHCPPPDDTPEAERWHQASWTLHDWIVAYASGGLRPDTVTVSGPDSNAVIADVITLPRADQLEWARDQTAILESTACD